MTNYSEYNRLGLKRNVVLNGNFNVWRRGTGPFATGGWTADLVNWGESMSTGVAQVSAESTLKPNTNCNYTYKVEVTTAQTTLGASEYIHFFHVIEGYPTIYKLFRKPLQLSFWVYASVVGTYCVWLRNGNNDASVVQDFTINSANTWEYKTITLPYVDNGIGTWNYYNGRGLCIGFTPCCGTTYQTSTLGQWISGNYIASTNISNDIQKTVSNVFIVSQVQLETGGIVTEFDHMEIEKESMSCYRYYQTFFVDTTQGLSLNTGVGLYYAHVTINRMNVSPTISFTSPLMWSPGHGWKTPTSTASTYTNTGRVTLVFNDITNSGYVAGQVGLIRISALNASSAI
jgi:hypothetical protein